MKPCSPCSSLSHPFKGHHLIWLQLQKIWYLGSPGDSRFLWRRKKQVSPEYFVSSCMRLSQISPSTRTHISPQHTPLVGFGRTFLTLVYWEMLGRFSWLQSRGLWASPRSVNHSGVHVEKWDGLAVRIERGEERHSEPLFERKSGTAFFKEQHWISLVFNTPRYGRDSMFSVPAATAGTRWLWKCPSRSGPSLLQLGRGTAITLKGSYPRALG